MSENPTSLADPRAVALRTHGASARENALAISARTSYAPGSPRPGVVIDVLLALLVGLAVVPLALGLAPAPVRPAFSERLMPYRGELAFFGVAMLLGVGIGFAAVLLLTS